jgi:hypothetical protein
MMTCSGAERIAAERDRQMKVEGWTPAHDDQHTAGELAIAAACYAAQYPIKAEVSREVPCSCREACCEHFGGTITKRGWQDPWPWSEECDKRKKHDRIKSLTIAGALIAAEIDRLLRLAETSRV